MSVNFLLVIFGTMVGAWLLLGLYMHYRKRKEEAAKPTPPIEFFEAGHRYVVHSSPETNRRDEANRLTNSNNHIVNISCLTEPSQQDEISEPPPPYFRDGDLPQYARNV